MCGVLLTDTQLWGHVRRNPVEIVPTGEAGC